MSSEMDRALLALSLKYDDDSPFTLPDLPQYYATERNTCSIIGRLLNPEFQRMSHLILELPRRWQKANTGRGFALTKERFQFVFMHEHDLNEILDKGIQTFDDWGLAIERWVERPSSGFLQYVSIWVRISNIPVNHYTKKAISDLGDLVGHVEKVAFDPDKPQRQSYVRVKIRFHVSKPLKKTRIINLPGGDQTTIYYYYERVQMRCHHCQRLIHARPRCPFLINSEGANKRISPCMSLSQIPKPIQVLSESDPLFGVLKENQVGINPISGWPRIAPEILQEMRNYLLASSNEDRHVREQRVISSVKEAEQNPTTQRSILQLIPPPVFTKDLDKGKGLVFGYDKEDLALKSLFSSSQPKLMVSAIAAGSSIINPTTNVFCRLTLQAPQDSMSLPSSSLLQQSSSLIQQSSSPIIFSAKAPITKVYGKRKPGRYRKVQRTQKKSQEVSEVSCDLARPEGSSQKKRKAEGDLAGASKAAKSNASLMVPREGPSNA